MTTHYIDKQAMHYELVFFNDTGIISEKLATQIVMIAVKIKDSHRFMAYEVDGMVEDAIAYCLEHLYMYKVSLSSQNPFHYFSQMIYWQYLHRIKKLKKEIRFKSHVENVADYMNLAYNHHA